MFRIMTGVLDTKKKFSPEDINKIPSFIFCRWLSGNRNTVSASNMFNLYSDIPIENQFNMIKTAFAGKIKFIPYPKKSDVDIAKKVEYLSIHFKITAEKANEYLDLIDKDELNEIIKMYDQMNMR